MKCANKAGNAYGFLIDNSLIKNTATGDAVAITVGIYVNPNEVINDNEYAYDEQGRPFMAALGSQLRRRFFAPPPGNTLHPATDAATRVMPPRSSRRSTTSPRSSLIAWFLQGLDVRSACLVPDPTVLRN